MYAPAHLLPWLCYEGFLTKKLYRVAGDTSMRVIAQEKKMRQWWDQYMLCIDCTHVIHREIVMSAREQLCWYARTIIPETTYLAAPQWFARLKTELLGTLLFEETGVTREFLIHYPVDQNTLEYHWLEPEWYTQTATLWARLSEFQLSIDNTQYPLFLLEILLPGLEKVLK